jgi:hypothetical protein
MLINREEKTCEEKTCDVKNCSSPFSHLSKSHHDDYENINNKPNLFEIEIKWLKSKVHKSSWNHFMGNSFITTYFINNLFVMMESNEKGKIFFITSSGMGTSIFTKRNHIDDFIEFIFVEAFEFEKQEEKILNNGYRYIKL